MSSPRSFPRTAALLGLPLLLSACAATRVAPPPPDPAPAAFKATGLWQHAAEPPARETPDAWWQLFGDAQLDALQARLVIGNENLKSAVAQVASARAVLGGTRAAQSPLLTAGLAATRADNGSSSAQNSVTLAAGASWEIDLWGRLSEATRASEARYQASLNDLAAARLSAQAILAQTYFSLRTAEAQQALIERSIALYQRSLDLTKARHESGVAALPDVLQAQTQLKTAQAQGLEAGNQRALAEHAIAVLLGQAPVALELARAPVLQELPQPPAVPPLLPSELLLRRPDIAAAERRVAAAYAQIGVADAAFFPSLTLEASAGLRGSNFARLLDAPTRVWSLGPALAQRLFDGGALRAQSEQARAAADQATALYRQTVLGALQEVEDNLVLADRLRAEAELQQEALQYAQRNLEITQDQYRVGTVSYLNVVTAQSTALNSERSLLELRNRQLAAVTLLLRNVAGRW